MTKDSKVRFFQRFFTNKKRPFSAWQIELTTRCPLQCLMCPRSGKDSWQNDDMDFANFEKLIPYFKDVETVVLEGWGESLLYPRLLDAIGLVKGEGAQVGFVTSGKGLDREYIFRLVEAGVDFLGFSLAGVTKETHDAIRVNSHLPDLLERIRTLKEIKEEKKVHHPRLHIIYLLLRDNITEIPRLPALAKELGCEEVVLTNLIHVTNPWQAAQTVFTCGSGGTPPLPPEDQRPRQFQEILREAETAGRRHHIPVKCPSLEPAEVAVCAENPLSNLYISTSGEVSPCVYLHPPVTAPFTRIFCGREYELQKSSFGNIFTEPFETIWNSPGYVQFRESFVRRSQVLAELQSRLQRMDGLFGFQATTLPDPPPACRTCHKLLAF